MGSEMCIRDRFSPCRCPRTLSAGSLNAVASDFGATVLHGIFPLDQKTQNRDRLPVGGRDLFGLVVPVHPSAVARRIGPWRCVGAQLGHYCDADFLFQILVYRRQPGRPRSPRLLQAIV